MATRRARWRALVAGFVVGVVLLAGLLAVLGLGDVVAAFRDLSPAFLAAVVAGTLGNLVVWGLAMHAVYAGLDHPLGRRRAVAAYAGVAFANRVSPVAQLGTEPVAAAVASRIVRTDYETSLAAVFGVDVVNFATSLALATSGLVYFATGGVLAADVVVAALALLVTAVTLVAAAGAAWRYRGRLSGPVSTLLASLARRLGRVVPGWTPPSAAAVRRRVDRFVANLDRLASAPRAVALALSLSAVGWFLLAATLHLSLRALGTAAPLVAPLFLVPLAQLAVVVPVPGGVGSVEAALVVLLVAAAGLEAPVAAAVALVYRGATYWLVLVVTGSVTAATLSAPRRG